MSDDRTGVMPGDPGKPIEILECEFCRAFKTANPRGMAIHHGKCEKKRQRDGAAAKIVTLPAPPPPTPIRDPALKQIEVYEQLVTVVRKSGTKSITIEKDGKEWHIDARWTE